MNVTITSAIGCFGDRTVPLSVLDVPGASLVVCLLHGVHGVASLEQGNKYGVLARLLVRLGVSVCVVETSRLRRDREVFTDRDRWAWSAFEGKTYAQELFDSVSGIAQVSALFPQKKLCLWGFSLGGLNALMVAGRRSADVIGGEFSPIAEVSQDRICGIVVSGSGDSLRSGADLGQHSLPILDSMCSVDILYDACRSISAQWLRFFYGSLDESFDEASCRRLFDLIPVDDRAFTVLPDVDHAFRSLGGMPSIRPLEYMVRNLQPQLQGHPGACPQ